MTMSLRLLSCLAACVLLVSASAEDRDRIVLKGTAFSGFVVSETTEGIAYKVTKSQPTPQTKRWSDVVSITYAGMDSGLYKAGSDAMAAGRYDEAANYFQALANGAQREWEGAYGFYRVGEAWELAGAYAEAAAGFGSLCVTYPEHRFFLDAKYRQGINLARTGSTDEAEAIINELEEIGKNNRKIGRGAKFRASAIRAAIAVSGANPNFSAARDHANKAAFSARDGDTWFHWGTFWAGLLREQGKYADAAREYEKMLSQVEENPSKKAQLSLGLGVCLANDGKKAAALTHLIKLDALPYGSPAQRCEAQYWAGRLLWETGSENVEDAEEKVSAFANDKLRFARVLLEAAANSISSHPSKQQATDFLASLPSEDGEEAAAEEAAPAAP